MSGMLNFSMHGRAMILNNEKRRQLSHNLTAIQHAEDPDRIRLTGGERERVIELYVMVTLLNDTLDDLKRVYRKVPRGSWAIKTAATLIKKVIKAITTDVMYWDEFDSISHDLMHGRFQFGISPIGSRDNYGVFYSFNELQTLGNALHDHCLMCMDLPDEQAACPLRKLQNRIPSTICDQGGIDCPYRGGV